ncbi:MAG TPA: ABC transporter permease [Dehalococcoidia bacterium]|nr:ABC transporter permease [Dehalococcoidia bacterium]
MDGLLQDIRYAVRAFLGNRGVALVAVLVLALGIGATTTVYSVVEGVLLSPLPYADAGRVVNIGQIPRTRAATALRRAEWPSRAEFLALRARNHSFEELSTANGGMPVLTGLGDATRLSAWEVMSNLFPMLGIQPILGRGFTAEEDRPGSAPVAILSYAFWSARFGRDPGAIGRSITLDRTDYLVVGVMPARFRFPMVAGRRFSSGADVWLSIGPTLSTSPRDMQSSAFTVGRLRPGVGIAEARADVSAVLRQLAEHTPRLENMVPVVTPMRDLAVGNVRTPLLLVLGAVGFVLLIACANVANLLLARAIARQREMAIRVALGATRWRIVRQLLTEAVFLALAGAAAGVLLATWGVPPLVSLAGSELPRIQQVGVNLRVLAAAAGAAVLTGVLFGLAPALHAVRGISPAALKEGSTAAGTGAGHTRASGAFVIVQVALTLVLLVGAGLLGRSFINLITLDPGFDAQHMLVAKMILPGDRYPGGASTLAFAHTTVDRLEALPGVTAAAVSTAMPLAGGLHGSINVAGAPKQDDAPQGHFTAVTPGYFRALGIPLRRGRLFRPGDRGGAQQVVVNDALTRALFPRQDPIGKRISFGMYTTDTGTIVGVVGNTRGRSLVAAPPPIVYESLADDPQYFVNAIVRTAGDPGALAAPLRATLRDIDPDLPVDNLQTMPEVMAESITAQRLYATLLGVFSTLALLMAAAGLYALVSYAVARRTREVGIRLALGALPRDVLRLVVGRGARLALAGICIGTVGALAATRVLGSFLFEITPTDPVVFVGVALGIAVVALGASWLPARRATRIDPVAVLRDE